MTLDFVSYMSMVNIENFNDSILQYVRIIADNSDPNPYTLENLTISYWNLSIAVIAAFFGILGSTFGYLGYKFSKKTSENVLRVSPDTQMKLFDEFMLDLYKNTSWALIIVIPAKLKQKYPSDNFLINMKLSSFDDIFFMDVYNQNPTVFIKMKHVKERMHVYDKEIDICRSHLLEKKLLTDKDLQDILYKPLRLLKLVNDICIYISEDTDYMLSFYRFILIKHIIHVANGPYNNVRKSNVDVYYTNIATMDVFSTLRDVLRSNLKQCSETSVISNPLFDSTVRIKEAHRVKYMEVVRQFLPNEIFETVMKKELHRIDIQLIFPYIMSIDAAFEEQYISLID